MSFEGTALLRVIIVGFAGSYDVAITSSSYKFTVGGDTVVPVTGSSTSETGYVGFQVWNSFVLIF